MLTTSFMTWDIGNNDRDTTTAFLAIRSSCAHLGSAFFMAISATISGRMVQSVAQGQGAASSERNNVN